MSYLNEVGVQIPGQIALIGFGNWFIAQIMSPKLSTVDQPSYEIGVAAFNLLLEEMICHKEGKVFNPRTIMLETSVVNRESSLKNGVN